jgi:hypothetical protein
VTKHLADVIRDLGYLKRDNVENVQPVEERVRESLSGATGKKGSEPSTRPTRGRASEPTEEGSE